MGRASGLSSLRVVGSPVRQPGSCALELSEVLVGYGLILAVIWTPRPQQRWWFAAAVVWFVLSTIWSFPGFKAIGLCAAGFLRSLWVVAGAVLIGSVAVALAGNLRTLHHPAGPVQWVGSFGGYVIWALFQQLLLQGYFLLRLVRVLSSENWAAVAAASLFAVAHLPNPILTPVTLLWGLVACFVFLRGANIWPLAVAHAIFGICLSVTVPGPVMHNMRVGLGYYTYRPPRGLHLSQSDHSASTVAWVIDDAPTRRRPRQALP
jgi:hypothetical protein